MSKSHPLDAAARLAQAENEGLRLAIFARTLVVFLPLVWYGLGPLFVEGDAPRLVVVLTLLAFTMIGIAHMAVIGTSRDRWWMKYAVYTIDIFGVCACFALVPISAIDDVPQILAFRAYGIYFLFPLIVMAALSLSWPLVIWAGAVAVIGWWSAFLVVISEMETYVSWADMPAEATTKDYQTIFLSLDFIGRGNRLEETVLLFSAALILALAVFRARRVFFRSVAAERAATEAVAARAHVTGLLGKHVPTAIVDDLINAPEKLKPKTVEATALVLDIAGFTAWSADKPATDVIRTLDAFLATASNAITDHGGTVISYLGDGLLATFNAPLALDAHQTASAAAAKALVSEARAFGFDVRIGLASGPIATGLVGSETRQSFTAYGTTINRAARLEALNKQLETQILLDSATAMLLPKTERLRHHKDVRVRGFDGPISVVALDPQVDV